MLEPYSTFVVHGRDLFLLRLRAAYQLYGPPYALSCGVAASCTSW